MGPLPIPTGMREVSKDEFFAQLKACPLDVMPSHAHPDHVRWMTNDDQKQVWGWSVPGWKYPDATPCYAIKEASRG